jgi:hypothetical protein
MLLVLIKATTKGWNNGGCRSESLPLSLLNFWLTKTTITISADLCHGVFYSAHISSLIFNLQYLLIQNIFKTNLSKSNRIYIKIDPNYLLEHVHPVLILEASAFLSAAFARNRQQLSEAYR